jgi:hypothetical protein
MGNHAPDVYLRQLEAEAGMPGNWMDDIVGTHLIDSRFLRGKGLSSTGVSDRSFAEYYETRAVMLKNLIDEAMGKTGPGAAEDRAVELLP